MLSSHTDGSELSYDDFHDQVDPDLNPFEHICFLVPPEDHESQIWESEKEVRVQNFSHYLFERFDYHHYSHPQIEYYVM